MIVNTYISTNGNFMFSSIRPTFCNSFAGGRRSRKNRDSFNFQQRSMQTRNGTSSLPGQSARQGSQHDTSLSWSGPYSDEVLNAVRLAPSSAFEILWSYTWAVKMCHSSLSDIFGTSLAMNNGYYLLVKIGMDNCRLIPAIFSQSFSAFGGLTDSGGLLERINYYLYWEPSSQFRVQCHDIAIILRNPSIRFNASLDRFNKLLEFPII